MIVPANIFVSNETCFAGDVAAADLVDFLRGWLHHPVPLCVTHAAGLRVHDVRVTRVVGGTAKIVVRHERNPSSPVSTPPPLALPVELADQGWRHLGEQMPEHQRIRTLTPRG